MSVAVGAPRSERAVLFVVGAVQFVNILDFMMVMPMGPDFARALGIPLGHIGYIGGSYTAAAAVSGLAGSFFLDRFDRKKALLFAMMGLVLGTFAGALAWDLWSLMAARMIAGAFGGPATSLALSIVADIVPPERRGRAVGAVMSAFSVASVLGVPAGLLLALAGWRIPFLAVGTLGALITLAAGFALPSLRGHIEEAKLKPAATFRELLQRPVVRVSWAATAVVMMAGFVLIPHLSSYVQENLNFPRPLISVLYLVGGTVSFFSMRAGGRFVDRVGSFTASLVSNAVLAVCIYVGFVVFPWAMAPGEAAADGVSLRLLVAGWPVVALFTVFMSGQALRNVAFRTLTSKVPAAHERARFMSIDSAVQHLASAAAAFLSARILVELPDGSLGRIDVIAWIAITLTILLPPMMWWVERRVVRPDLPALRGMQPHDPQSAVTSAGPGMPRPPPPR